MNKPKYKVGDEIWVKMRVLDNSSELNRYGLIVGSTFECRHYCDLIDVNSFDGLELDALRTENAALISAQQWIPVNERLPKEFDLVLVVGRYKWGTDGQDNKNKEVKTMAGYIQHFYEEDSVWACDEESLTDVTHWMPFPPPPKGGA